MSNVKKPFVSVVMIAYNVSKYIKEAIESVLSQKTDFPVELIIGEDCSTDNTREICLEYQKKYPNIIRVLCHEKNLGLTPNCIATHDACKGKYIALLDSDDYWTDNNKLQKQIGFLEANPDYSGCGTLSIKIFEAEGKQELFGMTEDQTFVLNDMITHRKFHTSSFVYHKEIWDKCGGIPPSISSNERAIFPMAAVFGKIKYMKDITCVYRIASIGLNSRIKYKELETDFNMMPWLKKIKPDFPVKKFSSFLHLCCYTYGRGRMPFFAVLKHYLLFSVLSFSYFPKNLGDIRWGTVFFFRVLKRK